jgi:cyclopropane fatty-acyl-phospholipid synthase-like methyltransferase
MKHDDSARGDNSDGATAEARTSDDRIRRVPEQSWDDVYQSGRLPWDVGAPQKPFAVLAEKGALSGTLLDVGCGTGEHALLAAACGGAGHGIDISPRAIEIARRKATERGLDVDFQVGDALHLESFGVIYDTIIDSGLFHVFDDRARSEYVESLSRVVRPGGVCYLMCFSDRQPGDMGPRRVSRDDLRRSFQPGWTVESIEATRFAVAREPGYAEAWLATFRRQ